MICLKNILIFLTLRINEIGVIYTFETFLIFTLNNAPVNKSPLFS